MPPSSPHGAAPLFADVDPALALRLLDRVIAGDTAALGELFVAYGDLVYRAALRLTGHDADAQDVTQEVFVGLRDTVRGFTGASTSFPAWIRRVAVREALMYMRSGRRRREVDVENVAALFAPDDTPLERITLERALALVSHDYRTVFLLKEVEGYDHAEIAELLGISVRNSEVRLHRARRKLREILRGSR
ncbi:MAG TPA: sigma-70 family RNA polymerase sigma factor [Gemmatimonadaceae bacterium]